MTGTYASIKNSDKDMGKIQISKMYPEEKWFPIIGYPGYDISNEGRVRSLKKRTPAFLKTTGGIAFLHRKKQQYTFKIERIYYAASRGIDLDSLKGFHVVGNSLDDLQILDRSEFISMVSNRRVKNTRPVDVEESYREAMKVTGMILDYYRTGDMNQLALYINAFEPLIKGYVRKNKYSLNADAIDECWQYVIEAALIAISGKRVCIPSLGLYLKRVARNYFVALRRERGMVKSLDEQYYTGTYY